MSYVHIFGINRCNFATCWMNLSHEYHACFSDRKDKRNLNQESNLSEKNRHCEPIFSRIGTHDSDWWNYLNTFEYISRTNSKSCTRYTASSNYSKISTNCRTFFNFYRIDFWNYASQKCSQTKAN